MQRDAQLIYRVPLRRRGWELSEEKMPESVVHDEAVELLKAILASWAKERGHIQVARNLAVRWDEEEPRVGADPDICVLSPPPPREDGEDLRSVRTWLPGHHAPLLAVEVVSNTNPHKDYVIAPDKYAASGTRELWIFDPLLSGPNSHGGPFPLQLWHRDDEQGTFVRAYTGNGPFYSDVLGAYVVVVEGRKLRIASDPEGTRLWPTAEEAEHAERKAERAAKEEALAAKEEALAAKEEALARIAELEAKLRDHRR